VAGPLTILALGGALVVAAGGFDSPSLLVPGLALTALGLLLPAWVEAVRRLARIEAAPGPAQLVEGDPYPLRVRVRTGPLPAPGGELRSPLLAQPLQIGPGRRSAAVDAVVERRGRRQVGPLTVAFRDPLGLRTAAAAPASAGEVLVLPRVEPLLAARADGGSGGFSLAGYDPAGAGSLLDAAAVDFEIDGLRPYREGSPASRIHWPAVARTGEMVERRLVAGATSMPLVILDAGRPASAELLDAAVRAAASLSVHLARAGGCALLVPGSGRPVEIDETLSAWPRMHARLALVEAGESALAATRVARGGAVFWVSANPATEAARDLGRVTARERWLVSPTPLHGVEAAFTVAGCHGQLLAGRRGARQPAAAAAEDGR
jgi:uncharacterized protein (DUF58 family)